MRHLTSTRIDICFCFFLYTASFLELYVVGKGKKEKHLSNSWFNNPLRIMVKHVLYFSDRISCWMGNLASSAVYRTISNVNLLLLLIRHTVTHWAVLYVWAMGTFSNIQLSTHH